MNYFNIKRSMLLFLITAQSFFSFASGSFSVDGRLYTVEKILEKGAAGTVYQVRSGNEEFAAKFFHHQLYFHLWHYNHEVLQASGEKENRQHLTLPISFSADSFAFGSEEKFYDGVAIYPLAKGTINDFISLYSKEQSKEKTTEIVVTNFSNYLADTLLGVNVLNKKGYVHTDIDQQNTLIFQNEKGLFAQIADLDGVQPAFFGLDEPIRDVPHKKGRVSPEILRYSNKTGADYLVTPWSNHYSLALMFASLSIGNDYWWAKSPRFRRFLFIRELESIFKEIKFTLRNHPKKQDLLNQLRFFIQYISASLFPEPIDRRKRFLSDPVLQKIFTRKQNRLGQVLLRKEFDSREKLIEAFKEDGSSVTSKAQYLKSIASVCRSRFKL